MPGSMESMDFNANCDFFALTEEKFDFDVSLSPASLKGDEDEDEDEVFVGPITHKEKCITVELETRGKDSVSNRVLTVGEEQSWSPLTREKFEEICKEAQQLACELEGNQQHPNNGRTKGAPTDDKTRLEDFVQDTGSKVGIFSKPTSGVLSPIKRETFCVQDSPMKQLPAAFQKRMLRVNGHAVAGGVACAAKTRVGSVSISSPVRGTKSQTQPKMVLRGRASLAGTRGVLPSKQAAPVGTTTQTRPAPERTTRLPPPRKSNFGSRRSLASCDSSRVGSSEDLLSDTASVASDVSDSSLNSSLQGRRGLGPPKKVGPRVETKGPPPLYRKGAEGKRNTSSSSSSVSSFNSSLSLSPTGKAKLNSSLNSSVGGPSGRIHTSVSRLANPGSAAKLHLRSSRVPEASSPPRSSAAGGRRSISAQGRRPSEVVRSTPIKRSGARPTVGAPTPIFQSPAKRVMERTSSVPNIPSSSAKPQSVVRANSKLKLFLAPTPTSQLKRLRTSEAISSPEAPRIMRPKRLVSVCSVDSLPLSQPAAPEPPQTPSTGGNKTLQSKMKLPSALGTPMNRRVSGIPLMTPKSVSRLGRPSLTEAKLLASSHWSPVQLKEPRQQQEVVEIGVPGEQPGCPVSEAQVPLFFLGNEPEAQPLPADPQIETQGTPSTVSEANQGPVEPSKEDQQEGQNAREQQSQTPEVKEDLPQPSGVERTEMNEVLLVDAPPPVLRLQEKLLIDLSNTPEMIRTTCTKPSGGQLIDLTSPLIKWSPETGKENHVNDAPLINLSF